MGHQIIDQTKVWESHNHSQPMTHWCCSRADRFQFSTATLGITLEKNPNLPNHAVHLRFSHIWGFPKMKVAQNSWFKGENPNLKLMIPRGTPVLGNPHSAGAESLQIAAPGTTDLGTLGDLKLVHQRSFHDATSKNEGCGSGLSLCCGYRKWYVFFDSPQNFDKLALCPFKASNK